MYESTRKSGELCPLTIRRHYQFVEQAFTDQNSTEKICEIFKIKSTDLHKDDFFFYLADVYAISVQYGHRIQMCNLLMRNAKSGMTVDEELRAVHHFGAEQGLTYDMYDSTALQNTTVDFGRIIRQWTYQYCNEFGFFQVPNPVFPLRSERLALPFWPAYCKRIFGKDMPQPHVSATNQRYGGLDISGENIFFSNSAEDPW